MKTEDINISPVNMEDRKKLGIKAGDTVRVWVKIQEKGKTRLQVFEGLVLASKHGAEPGASFTVRKVSLGVGIERIFPLYSPNIDKIEIVKRAKVRRAKLYHIREKVAREIKRQMRKMKMVNISSVSDVEEADRKIKEEESKKADGEQSTVNNDEETKKKTPTEDVKDETFVEEVKEEVQKEEETKEGEKEEKVEKEIKTEDETEKEEK